MLRQQGKLTYVCYSEDVVLRSDPLISTTFKKLDSFAHDILSVKSQWHYNDGYAELAVHKKTYHDLRLMPSTLGFCGRPLVTFTKELLLGDHCAGVRAGFQNRCLSQNKADHCNAQAEIFRIRCDVLQHNTSERRICWLFHKGHKEVNTRTSAVQKLACLVRPNVMHAYTLP